MSLPNLWLYPQCTCAGCLPREIMDKSRYELQYRSKAFSTWERSRAPDFAVVKSNIKGGLGQYRYRDAMKPKKNS